jgi:hypothetical protein
VNDRAFRFNLALAGLQEFIRLLRLNRVDSPHALLIIEDLQPILALPQEFVLTHEILYNFHSKHFRRLVRVRRDLRDLLLN